MFITRSPAENFLKFLISQQEHDTDAIIRIMEDFSLESVSSSYVNKLKLKMEPYPDVWEPHKADSEARQYLKDHGIHDLWMPHKAVQEAYKILGTPQLRADVEQLLLSPLRIEDVVKRLNDHHEVVLTVEGLAAFGHYFWNKSMLSMDDWVGYLETRPLGNQSIAVMRVSPDVAQTLVPWVAGLAGPPANLNTGMVSKRMRDIAFLKVLEIERSPATLAHSKMMKNYMDVIKAAEAELRQSDVALKDVLSAFDKFRLRKDDQPVPSIEEVAGPNYSQSGEGTDRVSDLAEDYVEDEK